MENRMPEIDPLYLTFEEVCQQFFLLARPIIRKIACLPTNIAMVGYCNA